jgi:hypothetical protein
MALEFAHVMLFAALSFAEPVDAGKAGECCCRANDTRVWIAMQDGCMTVSRGKPAPAVRDSVGPDSFLVACREFKSEAAPSGESAGIKLHCVSAEFVTGRGMEGRAAHVVYDSASGTLELRGDAGQDVQIWSKSTAGELVQVTAQEMRIDLQHQRLTLTSSLATQSATAACQCPAGGCCTQGKPTKSAGTEPVFRPAIAPGESGLRYNWLRFAY